MRKLELHIAPFDVAPGTLKNYVLYAPCPVYQPERLVLDAVYGKLSDFKKLPKTVHDLRGDDALGDLSVVDILVGYSSQFRGEWGGTNVVSARAFDSRAINFVVFDPMQDGLRFLLKLQNQGPKPVVVAGLLDGQVIGDPFPSFEPGSATKPSRRIR